MPATALVPLDAPIDRDLLDRSVSGHHVPVGSTLAELLDASGDRATLLVFLRHYG